MSMKTEALISAIVAVVVIVAAFFSQAFSIILAVAFLAITAVYKYFYAPKNAA